MTCWLLLWVYYPWKFQPVAGKAEASCQDLAAGPEAPLGCCVDSGKMTEKLFSMHPIITFHKLLKALVIFKIRIVII